MVSTLLPVRFYLIPISSVDLARILLHYTRLQGGWFQPCYEALCEAHHRSQSSLNVLILFSYNQIPHQNIVCK